MTLLLLPNLGIDQCIAAGLDRIWDIKLKLQIGQVNDAFHGLQLALVDKATVFQNAVWQAKSYAMKMQAWDMIHTINGVEMQKLHLTINTAAIGQNAQDHQASQLLWFWYFIYHVLCSKLGDFVKWTRHNQHRWHLTG
ncbi:hypothetical protein BKA82DRAFT_4017534 [Pisolithus tinctorius]|nr:hypothetical protein BKA82DRAFT_4017534 [Pisolithus tinctorius]